MRNGPLTPPSTSTHHPTMRTAEGRGGGRALRIYGVILLLMVAALVLQFVGNHQGSSPAQGNNTLGVVAQQSASQKEEQKEEGKEQGSYASPEPPASLPPSTADDKVGPGSNLYVGMVTSVRFSRDIWPHWLAYYTNDTLGFHLIPRSNFIVILHTDPETPDDDALAYALKLFGGYGIRPAHWAGSWTSPEKERVKNQLYKALVPADAWLLETDDDEFVKFPTPIVNYVKEELEAKGFNSATGRFVDRIASDCLLRAATMDSPIWDQFPCQANFTHKILKAYPLKRPLHKGYLFTNGGIHAFIKQNMAKLHPKELEVHHFKWRGHVLASLTERAEKFKKLGYYWWEESARLVQRYQEHGHLAAEECGCPVKPTNQSTVAV